MGLRSGMLGAVALLAGLTPLPAFAQRTPAPAAATIPHIYNQAWHGANVDRGEASYGVAYACVRSLNVTTYEGPAGTIDNATVIPMTDNDGRSGLVVIPNQLLVDRSVGLGAGPDYDFVNVPGMLRVLDITANMRFNDQGYAEAAADGYAIFVLPVTPTPDGEFILDESRNDGHALRPDREALAEIISAYGNLVLTQPQRTMQRFGKQWHRPADSACPGGGR